VKFGRTRKTEIFKIVHMDTRYANIVNSGKQNQDRIVTILNDAVRKALTAGHLAEAVTLNKDGSPLSSMLVSMAMKLSLVT
jgi:hypothetical protein